MGWTLEVVVVPVSDVDLATHDNPGRSGASRDRRGRDLTHQAVAPAAHQARPPATISDATRATPSAATITWTSISSQSMPLVTVGIPIARAIAVPMNADTMPTKIVSSIPDRLLARDEQSADYADNDADENRTENAGDCHCSSKTLWCS